jgi:hypothetical protein
MFDFQLAENNPRSRGAKINADAQQDFVHSARL